MKLHFVKILLIFIICGCGTSNKEKIQKTWIGKYNVLNVGTKNERLGHNGVRSILKFEEEQLTTKRFHDDFITDSNEEVSKSYKIKDKKILLEDDSMLIQTIFEDSLVFFSDSYKVVYEKLQRYNQGQREKELFDFITSNTFSIQEDTVQIEFRKDGTYVSDNFKVGVGSNQLWMLDKFEDELFLVLDGFWGGAFHIENLDAEKIVSKFYWRENKEIIFKRVNEEIGFEVSQIVGEWERDEDPMPPLPVLPTERKYYNKEFLKISQGEILRFKGYRRDTFQWELNRGRDIMILDGNRRKYWNPKQWNIFSIENDTLILEREARINLPSGSGIEVVKFNRNK